MRRLSSLLFLVVVSACGPMSQQCRTDTDCDPDSFCMNTMCVLREEPDAGQPSTDAGAVADAGAADAGNPADAGLDAGVVDAGVPDAGPPPECEVGDVRACCGDRGEQRCESVDGGSSWSACDAPIASESCNGIDDDCDGTIDDELAWDDGDGGVTSELACSIGVGACASNGFYVCDSSGMPTCGATVIDAGVEVCDGIDNDCDGTSDEGTKVTCEVDADNDRYAAPGTSAVEVCHDVMRAAFGNCPAGYVAPSSSLGTDCDDANASTFRNAQVRVDADGDAYCVGGVVQRCVGATLPSGVRDPSTCQATDDCSDSASERFRMASTRTDADDDGYCVGTAANTCIGATAPSGSKLASDCRATDDCDDASSAKYRVENVRTDADGDTFCVGPAMAACIGAAPVVGQRLSSSCSATEDCSDANAATFRLASVRTDADNDQACVGSARQECVGLTIPAGLKAQADCFAEADCDDTNASYYRYASVVPDRDNDRHCVNTPTTMCVGGTAARNGHVAPAFCSDMVECDDNNGGTWRSVSIRIDADGDTYCAAPAAAPACIGTNVPAGYRAAAQCKSVTDVIDSNPHATTLAEQTGSSESKPKVCNATHPHVTENLSITWNCPVGYHAKTSAFVADTNPPGSDALSYPNASGNSGVASSDFRCRPLSSVSSYWSVHVVCRADGL